MTEVLCIGEMMIELAQASEGAVRSGFGGDTFNTAVYLSRLGQPTGYLTAFGDDPWSTDARAALRSEGVDDGVCPTASGRTMGLYAIRTAKDGERSFTYWRDRSPARDVFGALFSPNVQTAIMEARLIYLSGISLWLYDVTSLDRLFGLLHEARKAGTLVAFDGNYRSRLWGPNREHARATYSRMLDLTDICLATAEDEVLLWDDVDTNSSHARLAAHGIAEIVLKCGSQGALIAPDMHVPTKPDPHPVDTTAAGDSFNAAYLAARLAGRTTEVAASKGNQLAGLVIRHAGAILPIGKMHEGDTGTGPVDNC